MRLQWCGMVVIATLVAGGAVVFAAGPGGGGGGAGMGGAGMGGGGMGGGAPFFFRGGGGSYAAFGPNAATVGESYARGIGELIRATGAVNLDLSEAALNLTEAESRQLKNDVDFVNTYFEVRRLSKQLRAQERGPRPSMEDLIRFAQLGKPQRLSPGDIDAANGQIFWPIILRAQVFASYRIKLETYFGERAQLSGLTPESYLRLDQTARAMVEELRRYVADFPPGDYLHSKHFIESLGYEAHFPVGQPVTTATASNNVVPAQQVR